MNDAQTLDAPDLTVGLDTPQFYAAILTNHVRAGYLAEYTLTSDTDKILEALFKVDEVPLLTGI